MERRFEAKVSFSLFLVASTFNFVTGIAHAEEPGERKDSSQLEWPVKEALRKYGIKLKMPYAEARARMLRNGWTPDFSEAELRYKGNYRPYKRFPEILCGEGFDAICSAPFTKDEGYHSIEVREIKGMLVVRGASE